MARLKVYGGMKFINGKQKRVFVATTSMKDAARITGESYSHMLGYWSETGNEAEIAIAMNNLYKPFYHTVGSGINGNVIMEMTRE